MRSIVDHGFTLSANQWTTYRNEQRWFDDIYPEARQKVIAEVEQAEEDVKNLKAEWADFNRKWQQSMGWR